MSTFLLPAGEIAEGVRRRLPSVPFIDFDEAQRGADLAGVEFYVPPYLGGPETVGIMGSLPGLRVVQALTAGVDWVLDAMPPGAVLCSARGVHDVSTAELVLAGILAARKRIPQFVRQQATATWHHVRTGALHGSRAVILGHGAIGKAVSDRLAAFGVRTVGVTSSGRAGTATLADLPMLLPECDILVITVPLTERTTGMVNGAMLAALPDGAMVVNAARGPVVDAAALAAELAAGRLEAVLDVTDPEPLPADSALWTLRNVLITPHVGGDSTLFPDLASELVADQMRRYLAGEPLLYAVNGR